MVAEKQHKLKRKMESRPFFSFPPFFFLMGKKVTQGFHAGEKLRSSRELKCARRTAEQRKLLENVLGKRWGRA